MLSGRFQVPPLARSRTPGCGSWRATKSKTRIISWRGSSSRVQIAEKWICGCRTTRVPANGSPLRWGLAYQDRIRTLGSLWQITFDPHIRASGPSPTGRFASYLGLSEATVGNRLRRPWLSMALTVSRNWSKLRRGPICLKRLIPGGLAWCFERQGRCPPQAAEVPHSLFRPSTFSSGSMLNVQ